MQVTIWPPDEPIETSVTLPLSKSESNRLLIIRALAGEDSSGIEVSDCDDTDAIRAGLAASSGSTVNVGPAGAAMRFLTAYFAARPDTEMTVDGCERMRQRPIGPLVDALRQCGAEVTYIGSEGFPPLHITGRQLTGGRVEIDATVSSQFISALMMVSPLMTDGLTLTLRGTMASRPYVEMTAAMMRRAGAEVEVTDEAITVAPGAYAPCDAEVEGDWSAASYWYAISALSSGFITLKRLFGKSIQGDSRIASLMKVTGLDTVRTSPDEIELTPTPDPGSRLYTDLADTPDLAQTLVVTCCLLAIPFRITGLRSLRIKETDRLEALRTELRKLGFLTEIPEEGVIEWQGAFFNPGEEIDPIETYGDHRMAMSFAPAALYYPGLRLNGSESVSKSYPDFWNDLERAGFRLEFTD